MCFRFQFCTHKWVCVLHFLKKVKFVEPQKSFIFVKTVFTKGARTQAKRARTLRIARSWTSTLEADR
jgi:hypothetical protein